MKPIRMLVVTPDGDIRDHTVPPGQTALLTAWAVLHALYELIGCSTVDVVRLGPDITMWVDDDGALRGSPINPTVGYIATRLGHHYQHFTGTAVFTGGVDAAGNTLPLSAGARATLAELIAELPASDDPE